MKKKKLSQDWVSNDKGCPNRVQLERRVQSAASACPLMSAEGEESSEQSMKMPLPSRQALVAAALPATRGRRAATHLAIFKE